MPTRRPHMHLPDMTEQAEFLWQHVGLSVQEVTFTPFLGAGASSLRPAELSRPPWDEVGKRISILLAHLQQEADKAYLKSVAAAHHVKVINAAKTCTGVDAREPLLALQLALTRLGSYLTYLFGQTMSSTRACVSEVQDYHVRLSDLDDEKAFAELLFDTLDAARKVHETSPFPHEPDEPKLEADAIYQKLIIFACRMGTRETAQSLGIHDRCTAHQKEIGDLCGRNVNLATRRTLRVDELSWLADLLWHTLRYRVPAYPTTAELTFQLSLLTWQAQELRRGELAQVAELYANYDSQVKQLRDWLRFCEGGSKPTKFHLSIAAGLQYEFRRWGQRPVLLPMAFTTNYDRALERAFECLGFAYHVASPLYVQEAKSKQAGEDINWAFKTWLPGRTPSLEGCMKWSSDELRQKDLRGPIVVKLHGSPLDDYPADNRIGDERYEYLQHCLVLSESSYLSTIVGQTPYPPWIEIELGDGKRDLWFLGYSITDWNVRLRLYEHIRRLADSVEGQVQERLALDRRFDCLRSAVLGALGVRVFLGELQDFGATLMAVPEVRQILVEAADRNPEVKQILGAADT